VSNKEIVEKMNLSTANSIIHLRWLSSTQLEITGLCIEIDKLVKVISDGFATATTKATATSLAPPAAKAKERKVKSPVNTPSTASSSVTSLTSVKLETTTANPKSQPPLVELKQEPVQEKKIEQAELVKQPSEPTSSEPQLSEKPASPVTDSKEKEEKFLINDLQWYQTRFLFEKKYFQYVAEEFKNLKVLLDKDLSKICFMGRKEDIESAKKLAFDILKNILGCEVACEPSVLEKMATQESEYSSLLRKENLCCVIDKATDKDKFTIYATSVEEIQKCKEVLLKVNQN
jgi:hypothetical protein